MRLQIFEGMMVADVQQQFTSSYPFLKIEFYKNYGKHKKHIATEKQIAPNVLIKDIGGKNMAAGELEIDDKMTVSDLEIAFMNQFGLTAEVLRRSGNIWLETSITDNWTLKQQNDHGREITIGKPRKDKDEYDYELNRDPD